MEVDVEGKCHLAEIEGYFVIAKTTSTTSIEGTPRWDVIIT